MRKMKLLFLVSFALFINLLSLPSYANNHPQSSVIGNSIIIGGGSMAITSIMPVVLKAYDRNRVVLGYITFDNWVGEPGTIFGDDGSSENSIGGSMDLPLSASIYYIMIDCKNKTYARYPHGNETTTGIKFFYNGDSFNWGEYKGTSDPHLFLAPWGGDSVTELFSNACEEA